ncbi:hypothetical protein J2S42_006884 [Catenuloplanes indicus]|uniref:DUF1152 domain-containing protein n=2 Tax=Catenuloplanes indicus TaxID=137267 RepID=A0AAE4B0E2_9ACTN|nr:hypothetical protein [Catenuloplanes indicus]
MSLMVPPLFAALAECRSVIVAGAGGGFDVYAGLPLAAALRAEGKRVHLASLAFTQLELIELDAWAAENLALVTPSTAGPDDYFPERTLARFLSARGWPDEVYAFPRVGVAPLRAAYRALIDRTGADALVLVDGGTDILLRGDEAGLGTPAEDMTSLGAAAGLDLPVKLVTSLGFGIDAFHGVVHTQVLENLAALDRTGDYLGALSVPSGGPEAALYRDAVADAVAATPLRPSIVQTQIAAALRGDCGDVHDSVRTRGSTLFVNPLMAIYFTVRLDALAARNLYLDRLTDTVGMRQVLSRIEAFRDGFGAFRTPRAFPH